MALSDGRQVDQDGQAQPVGGTADVKNATYTNSIGAPELAVVWTDPNFHPEGLALYYVRVLEIPTPRWTAYDTAFFGIEDITARGAAGDPGTRLYLPDLVVPFVHKKVNHDKEQEV